VRTKGAMTPKFEVGRDFCTPKFYHPMFTHSEVIMLTNERTNKHTNTQTNKQTDSTENTQRSSLVRLATTLGNDAV